ncbi:MAG: MaoC family dehydratase [Chloroflexota bacterium]
MGIERSFSIGDGVPPLTKTMTQEAINLFEGSSGRTRPSQFTDEATARETLGTHGTVASGRMSLTFGLEMLRRYFGSDIFNRTGMVDLRNLRPVRPGDTITLTGKVTAISREANGSRVTVEITVQNQDGNTTGVGTGSAIVPSGLMPQEE